MTAMSIAPKPTEESAYHPNKSAKANSAVLLVEDDDGVRRFLFWALYLEGFKVLTARGLSDAQRLSRDIPGRIEVLIIGSLSEGSTTVSLQQQIEAERPEVRTLLLADLESSGQQPETTERNHVGAAGLSPTVDAAQLIRKIKALVAASNG